MEASSNLVRRSSQVSDSAEAQKTRVFLEEQLPLVKKDMKAAEVALDTHRLEKGSIDLPRETQAILETTVAIESQLKGLQQERGKVPQGFTSAHPMVLASDSQIERLNGELSQLTTKSVNCPIRNRKYCGWLVTQRSIRSSIRCS